MKNTIENTHKVIMSTELEKPSERSVSELNNLVSVPVEVLDLLRFMCATWKDIDKWAYENMSGEALMKYPVIQGTRNQIDLQRIGEQKHDTANIHKAVEWMKAH
jgi:hypothetical protein